MKSAVSVVLSLAAACAAGAASGQEGEVEYAFCSAMVGDPAGFHVMSGISAVPYDTDRFDLAQDFMRRAREVYGDAVTQPVCHTGLPDPDSAEMNRDFLLDSHDSAGRAVRFVDWTYRAD